MTALLEARRVTKIFGGGLLHKSQTVALENFSFSVEEDRPSVTAIVGESGSGKTTLVRLLLGLITPTTGEVLYRGKSVQALSDKEQRAFLRDVQAIFQDPFEVYNPFYRVDHVLEAPIKNFGLAKSKRERRALMEQTLEAVGLRVDETLGRYPHQLSGGQRQRIMVARALLLRPRVIIADEPVSMVDASLRATILESLLKLYREFGISLVYITHDLTTAYQISHNIIVLYRGAIAEAGDVQRVVRQPEHPYTRLLVGSIPLPDPDLPWQGERVLGKPAEGLAPAGPSYCRFYERCPSAMAMCVEQAPPLFQTDPHRVTACFLYREAPAVSTEDLATVFTGNRHEPAPVAAPAAVNLQRSS
ncbi:MAG: ABC transporter ATP-binding protein [Thermomicrobiales bacterium]|nr:MAG: ABC transporter ATP-binding protein [Thermomicrobiales bacterium]